MTACPNFRTLFTVAPMPRRGSTRHRVATYWQGSAPRPREATTACPACSALPGIQYAVGRAQILRPDERLLQTYRQCGSIIFPSTVAELQQICRNSVAVIGSKWQREELGARDDHRP
jgi:hypothetical protein